MNQDVPRPPSFLSSRSSDAVLGLKDPARPFPSGAPLGVLKWRLQTRDESVVPLSINCWPSISGGVCVCVVRGGGGGGGAGWRGDVGGRVQAPQSGRCGPTTWHAQFGGG
jgi:hypothetical protein